MSVEFKNFIETKRLIEQRQVAINCELKKCEEDIEALRLQYSKNCDHPTRVCQFPVCGICFAFVPTEGEKE